MLRVRKILIFLPIAIIIGLVSVSFMARMTKSETSSIIATVLPTSNEAISNLLYPTNARLIQYDLLNKHTTELTTDFQSARGATASFNGQHIVFSGIKSSDDQWQIWELNLSSHEYKQVTNLPFNCTDPAYLPNGAIVFSGQHNNTTELALFSINAENNLRQLTFHPAEDRYASVLMDGRILVNSTTGKPSGSTTKQLVLRPDGTKALLYHHTDPKMALSSKAIEDANRNLYYVSQIEGTSVVNTFQHNDPNATNFVLGNESDKTYLSVYPINQDSLLVNYITHSEEHAMLGLLTKEGTTHQLLAIDGCHVLEASILQNKTLPKILPSRIEETGDNGLLLGVSTPGYQTFVEEKISSLEIWTDQELLGKIPVQPDGSYYVEVPSNTPLKVVSFDANDQMLQSPSDWFWVKPKERRGCIGCHSSQDWAPDNKVPLAVREKPIDLVPDRNELNPLAQ